jgi:sirohydrochlorin ferrochelatase
VTAPLVAVSHGSRDPAAAESTRALLAEVRAQRPGLEVLESYLDHAGPLLADVLDGLGRSDDTPVVVPLLLGAAYHSKVDIPAVLEAAGVGATQADVLGPDPLLLDALERRLAEAGVAAGDPSTAVVLAAAGSTDESAVDGVRALAAGWAARGWWAVEAAFASAATPTVADAVTSLRQRGAPRVVVATYLLSPGLFADTVATAGADLTGPVLGDAPEVAALVLARYDAAVLGSSRVAPTLSD